MVLEFKDVKEEGDAKEDTSRKLENHYTQTGDQQNEMQENETELPFPKTVFFITINEFCERFCYYGMRTVLSIYLTDFLLFSESDATIIYHTFIMLAYFFPLIGAIVADSFWGKFNTIFYISMVYAIGSIVLSVAAVPVFDLPHRLLSIIGLLCIAIGTGGIKPCVSTFGADQFVLPQQENYLGSYYSLFYFAINVGSLLSTALTPTLREDVHCYGEESCFSLAFGVPAVLMIAAIVIIAMGRPYYKYVLPVENIFLRSIQCIWIAIKRKLLTKTKEAHWLDYALPNFSQKFVADLKQSLNVLLMFITFPIFWALCDQTGSGWTFQARRMKNDLGFYTIPPDQMQLLAPFFYTILIPVFHYFIYPFFDKINILKGLLSKVAAGSFITALAFVATACVSLALEATYPVLPKDGVAHLRIYNTMGCDVTLNITGLMDDGRVVLENGSFYENLELDGNRTWSYKVNGSCGTSRGEFNTYNATAVGYYFRNKTGLMFLDDASKHSEALVRARFLVNTKKLINNKTAAIISKYGSNSIYTTTNDTRSHSFQQGIYTIKIGGKQLEYNFSAGGVYAILAVAAINSTFNVNVVEVTPANSISILWLIPQYFILAVGELLFNVPGAEFAYSQSPVSMKSLILSAWLLTTAFGNLIVVLIEAASFFESASNNFFLYAVLMFVDMIIFTVMAGRYRYVQVESSPKYS